jgi:hypothetical protein
MKRFVVSMLGSLAVATTLVAAQNQPKPAAPQNSPSDTTLTGCVTQGSSPTVFLLGNARMNARDTNEKGKDYILVAATEDLSLKTHLNHEVTVTGNAETKVAPMPPAGQKVNEKDLPKLTAKSVTEVADTCTMSPR